MRKTGLLLASTGVAVVAMASAASAAVTFDPSTGTGFVGKGDVQTVLGYNNAQLQSNAKNLNFTYSRPATQALSQDADQVGTQSGDETLTCVDERGRNVFTRAGTREGSRDADRSGARTGTQSGALSDTVAYDSRTRNQVNGFNLTGFTGPQNFVPSGSPTWDAWSFGSWSFDAWSWEDWTVDPSSSPGTNNATLDACLNNGASYDSVTHDVTEGSIEEGAITEGAVQAGAVTPNGTATLYVNGVALS